MNDSKRLPCDLGLSSRASCIHRPVLKIVFLDTGTSRQELNEPLGIENLVGQVRHAFGERVQAHLLSLQMADLECCLAAMRQSDLVGISVQIGSSSSVFGILDALFSGSPPRMPRLVVLGNVVPTFAGQNFLITHPNVVCVRGEGEDAIIGIIESLLFHHDSPVNDLKMHLLLADVPNVLCIVDGQIRQTSSRLVNLEKTSLPHRDLLPAIINERGIIRIEGSRGCPWSKCTFCSISAKYCGGKWRPFPISRVIQDLAEISRMGGRSPYFTDEDFLGNDGDRAFELARAVTLAKRTKIIAPDLDFFVSTSVRSVLGFRRSPGAETLLTELRRAGLREVFLGLESGSPSQLERYGKGVTPDTNREVLQVLAKVGLTVDVGFIMFDPEMSLDDLMTNLRFIRETALSDSDARLTKSLRILPETVLARQLQNQGLIQGDLDTDQLLYRYSFKDPLVQIIFEAFTKWEQQCAQEVYAIQGQMRGETPSEEQRAKYRAILRQLRHLDLEFLEASLLGVAKHGKNIASSELRSTVEQSLHLQCRRSSLISNIRS